MKALGSMMKMNAVLACLLLTGGVVLAAGEPEVAQVSVSGTPGQLTGAGGGGGGESIKAKPLRGAGKPAEAPAEPKVSVVSRPEAEAKTVGATGQKDQWFAEKSAGDDAGKGVMNASAASGAEVAVAAPGTKNADGTVNVGAGFTPVVPGYARQLSVPYTSLGAPGLRNQPGVIGPSYTYPYRGYYNNPFTGLSSYSNGYAGAPASTVPFAGGWFQGRSAFYSQPTMIVPTYPVAYPVYQPVVVVPACPRPVPTSGFSFGLSVGYQSSSTTTSTTVISR